MAETSNPFPDGRYYTHSGTIPKNSILIALSVLVPVAAILGVAYGIGEFWTRQLASLIKPFPLIGNFADALTIVPVMIFVVLIVRVSDMVGRARAIRSPAVTVALGLGTACLAYYVGWAWWLGSAHASGESAPSLVASALGFLVPANLWAEMLYVAKDRGITIFVSLPRELNWAYWIIEAGLIIGGVYWHGLQVAFSQPYCERCQRWFTQQDGVCWFEGAPQPDALRAAFDKSQKEPLDLLTPLHLGSTQQGPEGLGLFYRADLEYCPSCEEACIDIAVITRKREPKHKGEGNICEKTTSLVENLRLTPGHFARIRECTHLAE